MDSDQAFDELERISAIRGRKDKEAAVAEALRDAFFRDVVIAAYCPWTRYHATTISAGAMTPAAYGELPGILGRLSRREVTGDAASRALTAWAGTTNTKGVALLTRILNKDLRAGFTDGTVNRVAPGTIRVFDVMLAQPFSAKRITAYPVAGEPKTDGLRTICIVEDGSASFLSRTGKPHAGLEEMAGAAAAFALAAGLTGPHVFDGEVTAGSFQESSGHVRRKSGTVKVDFRFTVFDAMPKGDFEGGAPTPDRERRARLERMFASGEAAGPFELGERRILHSAAEVDAYYAECRDRGHEGAIVKPLEGVYELKRSYAWMKMKPKETEDLTIVSAFEGAPGTKYEGCLGGLVVARGAETVRVGSGFSDRERRELWDVWSRHGEATGPLVGRMVEVEFHEPTENDKSLRHPRFKKFRDDKHQAT